MFHIATHTPYARDAVCAMLLFRAYVAHSMVAAPLAKIPGNPDKSNSYSLGASHASQSVPQAPFPKLGPMDLVGHSPEHLAMRGPEGSALGLGLRVVELLVGVVGVPKPVL